jgi:hypothetical protein
MAHEGEPDMDHIKLSLAFVAASVLSTGTWAGERAEHDEQRNADQQQRIEQGLKSGEITTHEASRLEHEQQHVDHVEARALQDGRIDASEQARIHASESHASRDIYRQKHDAADGNPDSASSRRMQADVQRDRNQQERIQDGLESGALTNREAASLERGQARDEHRQAKAAADGHVGPGEQRRIRGAANQQSGRIYRTKHNARAR